MDIAEEKQAQRTSGKAARRALSPEQRAAANAALCARLWQLDAVQNAQTILLYAAFGGEAGLAGFVAEAARRGKVLGSDSQAGITEIKAHVPMSEVLRYAPDLRSMTGGQGFFTMEFDHYEEAPQPVAEKVIAEHQAAKAAE